MVKFREFIPQGPKRDYPKNVRGLAKKIFGKDLHYFYNKEYKFVGVGVDGSERVAEIYSKPKYGYMDLFNPLYIEEARRFAQAYEDAFLNADEGEQFMVRRSFPIED